MTEDKTIDLYPAYNPGSPIVISYHHAHLASIHTAPSDRTPHEFQDIVHCIFGNRLTTPLVFGMSPMYWFKLRGLIFGQLFMRMLKDMYGRQVTRFPRNVRPPSHSSWQRVCVKGKDILTAILRCVAHLVRSIYVVQDCLRFLRFVHGIVCLSLCSTIEYRSNTLVDMLSVLLALQPVSFLTVRLALHVGRTSYVHRT